MEHVRQHYVPESYLRAWCDPDAPEGHEPYVWVFSKDGRASPKAPANIFHERDFYTIRNAAGGRDLRLEHDLSALESRFASVRRTKLALGKPLRLEDKLVLSAFTAAMQERTRAAYDRVKAQYKPMLDTMAAMQEWLGTATPQQIKRLRASSLSDGDEGQGLSYEQVRSIVEEPMQSVLAERVAVLTPMLLRLDLAILEVTLPSGFVTSDNPCVWADPEGHARPAPLRGPALMYETIEITMPVSPTQVLLFNRQGVEGYRKIVGDDGLKLAGAIDRRTTFEARDRFIWCGPQVRPDWLP